MSDDYADRIEKIAGQLILRVHDDDPDDVGRWLRNTVSGEEWCSLAVVLACAVPPDRTWSQLTAWARMPLEPRNEEAVQALTAERFAHVMPPDLPRGR